MFKITALLAVLLLALAASPAFADSIPPPVTNLPMTGMVVSGFFNSSTNYDLGSNKHSRRNRHLRRYLHIP